MNKKAPYKDIAKQYEKHSNPKQWIQEEMPNRHPMTKEQYYSHVSNKQFSRKLTQQEVNDLFWDILINLGWKLDTTKMGERKLLFPCPKCNMVIDSLPYDGLLEREALSMKNVKALNGMIETHNNEPCVVLPEE